MKPQIFIQAVITFGFSFLLACFSTVTAQGTVKSAADVAASSQLIERNRPADAYKAENLTDGNIATAWAEGADGAGIGEWIRFDFDTLRKIKAVKILAGYAKTDPVYWNNNRVKKVKVIFSDGDRRSRS